MKTLRPCLAEFLGTFYLCFAGIAVILCNTPSRVRDRADRHIRHSGGRRSDRRVDEPCAFIWTGARDDVLAVALGLLAGADCWRLHRGAGVRIRAPAADAARPQRAESDAGIERSAEFEILNAYE